MKWTDTLRIAEALVDKHPDVDPLKVRFTDLHHWVWSWTTSTTNHRVRMKRYSRQSRWPG